MKQSINILILSVLLLASCFKEEQPVLKKDRGDVVSQSVEMGVTYDKRFYISLDQKNITGEIDKFTWDIGLAGDSLNPYIRLNTALGMYAVNTYKTSIFEVSDTAGMMQNIRYDYPGGHADSLALSGILDSNQVFLIYLGTDQSFQSRGFLLLSASLNTNKYQLHYRYLNSLVDYFTNVSFNSSKQHILYNFKSQTVKDEPALDNWDFQITQYTHIYYDPFQTYSVVGCLINPYRVEASEYSGSKSFSEITFNDAQNLVFSKKEDIIGFSWKYYDLNNNKYVVKPEKSYIIRRQDGRIFKLHFIGFYNSKGEKGSPIFEYKEL
jgi:hypothetical protein